jgi:hypothetical protein
LLLTRFVVCACRFANQNPDLTLADVRLCYDIERSLGKREREEMVPDAWLLFEQDGKQFPVLVEIDRGTEYQERFKNHVRGRLEFIRSGDYAHVFETTAVIIAYATSGRVQQDAEIRRKTRCTWTMDLLKDLKIESWASIFRLTSAVEYKTLYEEGRTLFTQAVWYRPDSPTTAVPLLG